MTSIDLNSDLGENEPGRVVGDDASMLRVVSSANISCGFHAGTPEGIRQTLGDAQARSVTIGAHPGYRDHDGFGRRAVDIANADLQAHVEYQLGALAALAGATGGKVRYVKPHGALYNRIARDEQHAQAVVDAVLAFDPSLIFLGLAGSVAIDVAERAGLATAAEAFADRAYTPSGHLVDRREPGSVLHDPAGVAARMVRLATEGVLQAIDGSDVRIRADSICVHGDSPAAVAMAEATRSALESADVTIASFAAFR